MAAVATLWQVARVVTVVTSLMAMQPATTMSVSEAAASWAKKVTSDSVAPLAPNTPAGVAMMRMLPPLPVLVVMVAVTAVVGRLPGLVMVAEMMCPEPSTAMVPVQPLPA